MLVYAICILYVFTGCDRGFGETLACKLALEGYEIYAGCLDTASDGAKRLQNYAKVTILQVDVTDDKSVEGATQILFQNLSQKGEDKFFRSISSLYTLYR